MKKYFRFFSFLCTFVLVAFGYQNCSQTKLVSMLDASGANGSTSSAYIHLKDSVLGNEISECGLACQEILKDDENDGSVVPAPRLIGRFDLSDANGPKFNWPATAIEAKFRGTAISVRLKQDETMPVNSQEGAEIYFTKIIDGGPPNLFATRPGEGVYQLAANLPRGEHTVRIIRNNEGLFGVTQFKGFEFPDNGELLIAPAEARLKMEVIGDSLTAGFGSIGPDANCPFTGATESAYQSYASVAARLLNADVNLVAISGRGVYRNLNGIPNDPNIPTMRHFYIQALQNKGPYDFAQTKSKDIVVINLGTNDFSVASHGPINENHLESFISAYREMINLVRTRNRAALIFAATPAVLAEIQESGSPTIVSAVKEAVRREKLAGDSNIFWVPLFNPGTGQGNGCAAHLGASQNNSMGAELAAAIREKL